MKRVVVVLVVIAALFALAACTKSVALTNQGAAIRVLSAHSATSCASLGKVKKANTNTWQSADVARADARNKLLNASAAKGGTHVVLGEFNHHLLSTCEDCVEIAAEVYRCDGPVADQPMPALEPTEPAEPEAAPAESVATTVSESNHDGHDDACNALSDVAPSTHACVYDTECVLCHDGEGCGVVMHRDAMVAKGPACFQADKGACEAMLPRCCAGHCVVGGQ